MDKIYLDYNASTPIDAEVARAMAPFLEGAWGNPSSLHWASLQAKEAYQTAKIQIADRIGALPSEIVMTSGGSEANNLALKGVFFSQSAKGKHIITSSIEHPAILEPLSFLTRFGAEITYLPVDSLGRVDPADLKKAIRTDTILVSIMHANNEIGTIQDIAALSSIAHERKVLFHTDAAQSVGKIPVDVETLGVDLLTIAGHKIYAPKGVGALYVSGGVNLEPLIHGGGQEDGRRAGTESALMAVALGKACEIIQVPDPVMKEMKEYFISCLQERFGNKIFLNGNIEHSLPNTVNVSFLGYHGAEILGSLPLLAASTGSACHSGSAKLSGIFREIGANEERARGAIRFSLGRYTTYEELDNAVSMLAQVIN
ncbi:MAG: cysteine desulfurase [Bacteroidia bacterium]|nr:cysteine desulfurase [Bacteroidia bacterium]